MVLLYYCAEWCCACIELSAVLEEMAPTYRDRIQFCKVEIEENPVLVEKYLPDRSFHCLVIMKKGKVLGRKYGVDPDTEADLLLKDWLKKFVP